MEKGKFLSILNKLQNICNQVNYEESDSDVIYEVLQFSKLANSWDSVYRIANFYNHNWLGNVDFVCDHLLQSKFHFNNIDSTPQVFLVTV